MIKEKTICAKCKWYRYVRRPIGLPYTGDDGFGDTCRRPFEGKNVLNVITGCTDRYILNCNYNKGDCEFFIQRKVGWFEKLWVMLMK